MPVLQKLAEGRLVELAVEAMKCRDAGDLAIDQAFAGDDIMALCPLCDCHSFSELLDQAVEPALRHEDGHGDFRLLLLDALECDPCALLNLGRGKALAAHLGNGVAAG